MKLLIAVAVKIYQRWNFTVLAHLLIYSCLPPDFILDYNAEKHRQLHIILAIIVSVFSACVMILVGYMLIFPATYVEVDTRPRSEKQGSNNIQSAGSSSDREVVELILHCEITLILNYNVFLCL